MLSGPTITPSLYNILHDPWSQGSLMGHVSAQWAMQTLVNDDSVAGDFIDGKIVNLASDWLRNTVGSYQERSVCSEILE